MSDPLPRSSAPALDASLADVDLSSLDATGRLRWAWQAFGARAAIGTSFQGAGLVTIDLARSAGLDFPVFTLDTGLLFPETLELWKRLERHFGISIQGVKPILSVNAQAHAIGPELWKSDPDFCCTLRKVEPLREHLAGSDAWITGLRRDQSSARNGTGILERHEIDAGSGRAVWKLNPLADWSREAVWDHLRRRRIPYNPLHDRGYRSIGCIPCTRPSSGSADERAGRWTGFNKTECGIHTFTRRLPAAAVTISRPAEPGPGDGI